MSPNYKLQGKILNIWTICTEWNTLTSGSPNARIKLVDVFWDAIKITNVLNIQMAVNFNYYISYYIATIICWFVENRKHFISQPQLWWQYLSSPYLILLNFNLVQSPPAPVWLQYRVCNTVKLISPFRITNSITTTSPGLLWPSPTAVMTFST